MTLEKPTLRESMALAVKDGRAADLAIGAILGAGAGYWAISVKAIEGTESTDLIALAGAGVGLLAATLAAIALLLGFMNGRTLDLLRDFGMDSFVSPFRIVAIVTSLSILTSVAGAIDTSSFTAKSGVTSPGPTWLGAVLFGIAIWFFVWAVIGVTQLVKIFIRYGRIQVNLGHVELPTVDLAQRGAVVVASAPTDDQPDAPATER